MKILISQTVSYHLKNSLSRKYCFQTGTANCIKCQGNFNYICTPERKKICESCLQSKAPEEKLKNDALHLKEKITPKKSPTLQAITSIPQAPSADSKETSQSASASSQTQMPKSDRDSASSSSRPSIAEAVAPKYIRDIFPQMSKEEIRGKPESSTKIDPSALKSLSKSHSEKTPLFRFSSPENDFPQNLVQDGPSNFLQSSQSPGLQLSSSYNSMWKRIGKFNGNVSGFFKKVTVWFWYMIVAMAVLRSRKLPDKSKNCDSLQILFYWSPIIATYIMIKMVKCCQCCNFWLWKRE